MHRTSPLALKNDGERETGLSVTIPLKPGINPTLRGIVVQVRTFGLKMAKKAFSD